MTIHVMRPTAFVSGSSRYANASGSSTDANVLAAINDNSDTTYIRRASGSEVSRIIFELTRPTLAAGELINHVRPVVRYKGTAVNYSYASVYMGTYEGAPGFICNSIPIVDVRPGWWYNSLTELNNPTGLQIKLTHCDEIVATDPDRPYVYELYGEACTVTRPVITPSNKTETASPNPTLPASLQATVDSWVTSSSSYAPVRTVRVDVVVESGGTGYGTGTFVAAKSESFVFDATETKAVNVRLGTNLSNGSYKVYMRAARFTQSLDGTQLETTTDWSSATLTMNAAGPTVTFVSTESLYDKYISLVIQCDNNTPSYTNPKITLQRSNDGGVTWKTFVENYAGTSGGMSFFKDYEAVYSDGTTTTKYRVKVSATGAGGIVNESPWVYNTDADNYIPIGGWNLKCLADPTKNMYGVHVVGEPSEKMYEDVAVFRPLDRTYAVAVSGTRGGWDGDFDVKCNTISEWNALKALIESQSVLLLESVYGGHKYMRITDHSVKQSGPRTAPRRSVSLSYVECDA